MYVLYAWPANSTSNSDYLKVVETKRDNLAKNVLAVQVSFPSSSSISILSYYLLLLEHCPQQCADMFLPCSPM